MIMEKGRTVKIGNKVVGEGHPVFVIAEVGVNHNGKMAIAKKLIDVAVKAGADAVKFQMCDPDEMVTKSAPKAAYQKKTQQKSEVGESQYDMLKRYYFDTSKHKQLMAYAKKKKIILFSTPFSLKDARELAKLKMPAMKVGSSDTNNHPQLKIMARAKVPMLLSTGMANLKEVHDAVKVIRAAGNNQIVVLHCTTAYPTVDKDVNLRAMVTMGRALGTPFGYSDHTPGIVVDLAATALGACMIEKHVTLDKTLHGPDHFASLEPDEFAEMIRAIRRTEAILGNGKKEPTQGEKIIAKIARKSIVAARDLIKGERIKENDLEYKRPGTGMAPALYKKVVGKCTLCAITKDTLLSPAMLQ